MKRVLASALLAAGLTILGTQALAAPGPTPTTWTGACNMMASWPGFGMQNENGRGVQSGGGMELAMTVNTKTSHGNDGMFLATQVSGGSCE